MNLELNKVYSGFKLVEEKEIKEINSIGRLFEHVKTGAQLYYISNDDDNKVFSITFRTPPADDTGLPHIMEHSVLCGSTKFPSKEPFTELLKGSLKTFLNAMTFSDKTMYPVASKNNQDFKNLMDVYLDAVLHPNIHVKPEILMQEGWHYELDGKDKEITYKGVVYNEMRGAFSDPERILMSQIESNLFPDNCYRNESGGIPSAIVDLTPEQFLNFHKKYYHPSNSRIFLYGNGDLLEHLQFINEKYLQDFDKIEVDSSIATQKPFSERKELESEYSISLNEESNDKTFLSMSFVTGEATNPEHYLAFAMLEEILLGTPASPLKNALIKAKLGKDVWGQLDNYIKQPVFSIVVTNSEADKKEQMKQIVFDTLKKLVAEGIDKKLIEAVINSNEFDLREADYHSMPKGLFYSFKMMSSWLYDADPTMHIAYENTLNKIKSALTTNYFEELIEKFILQNQHSIFITLKPKKGLADEAAAKLREKLADYKSKLSDQELDKLIEDTAELKRKQAAVDTPEALASIPHLELKDINPKADIIEYSQIEENGVKLLYHPEFTNKIAYFNMYFDTSAVPEELLPYVSLTAKVLSKISTDNYKYQDLSNEININAGGLGFDCSVITNKDNADVVNPKFSVKMKALIPNLQKSLELLKEIILSSKFDESSRIKEIINEEKARLKMRIMGGFFAEQIRLSSYFSNSGKFNDLWQGLGFYNFLNDLEKDFDNKSEEITAKLKQTCEIIFNKQNLLMSMTCSESDFTTAYSHVNEISNAFTQKQAQVQKYEFPGFKNNEGLMIPGDVQYVTKGFNFRKLGFDYQGSMQILRTIISLDYFWNNIRVMGGAYGCRAAFSRNGNVIFGSYRDPNLAETINIYNELPNYLESFQADEREMTKYIIGTISSIDFPLTPSMKASKIVENFVSGIDPQEIQQERDEILSTKFETVKQHLNLISEVLKKDTICVLGNETKIKENGSLFNITHQIFD